MAALTVLFLLALTSAQGALQFDVFLGYDGIVPEAAWFPVVCEIKNDGPSFTGVVEVNPGSYNQGQSRRMAVALPTGTLKRIVIPVFSTSRGYTTWDVRLLDERGKGRAEQIGIRARKQIASGTPLLGAITRTASGTPVLRAGPNTQSEMQPSTARLQTAILPDNPLVLEGMQTLYLSSEKATELRAPNQVEALYAWVNAGGHLIVGVEQLADINSTPWLKELFPVEVSAMRGVKPHPELQEWIRSANYATNVARSAGPKLPGTFPTRPVRNRKGVLLPAPEAPVATPPPLIEEMNDDLSFETAELQVATGAIKEGRAAVSVEGVPLVVTASRGLGQVTALLFSPEREPFRSWKNLPTFWTRVAEVPSSFYSGAEQSFAAGMSTDGIFGAMIDTRQVHKLPVGWLLLLLIIYLVVIGPLDQYWLKKIRKPMLTWITFPCYVLMFSLLIYVIGYRLRAGESEWNELNVVDVMANRERAELRGRTYASVYAPSNQRYLLESPEKYATLRGEFVGIWGGGQSSEKATVVQNGDSFTAEIFVPVWTSQLFISDWWQGADMPLNMAITPKSDGWQVSVTNQLGQKLDHIQIAIEGQVVVLGEVPANQTKTFTVTTGQGRPLKEFVADNGRQFQSVVSARQQAFGARESGKLSDLPNSTIAASFISQLSQEQNYMGNFVAPPGLDLSAALEHGNAVVFAWAEDFSPVAPMHKAEFKRKHKNTMFRVTVPVRTQNAAAGSKPAA
jgi:hypothetical protein